MANVGECEEPKIVARIVAGKVPVELYGLNDRLSLQSVLYQGRRFNVQHGLINGRIRQSDMSCLSDESIMETLGIPRIPESPKHKGDGVFSFEGHGPSFSNIKTADASDPSLTNASKRTRFTVNMVPYRENASPLGDVTDLPYKKLCPEIYRRGWIPSYPHTSPEMIRILGGEEALRIFNICYFAYGLGNRCCHLNPVIEEALKIQHLWGESFTSEQMSAAVVGMVNNWIMKDTPTKSLSVTNVVNSLIVSYRGRAYYVPAGRRMNLYISDVAKFDTPARKRHDWGSLRINDGIYQMDICIGIRSGKPKVEE